MTSEPEATPEARIEAEIPSHPGAATHIRGLLATARRQQLTIAQTAYILALAQHNSRMGQVMDRRTSGWSHENDLRLGNTERGDGPRFRGRGYLPIIGRNAYQRWAHHLDLPLVEQPELVAQPDVAADILVLGVAYGRFTGRTLGEFVNHATVDYVAARLTVPMQDQAGRVAALARRYEAVLMDQPPRTPSAPVVRQAQRCLRAIGWPVVVDGVLTTATSRAIADFQRGYTGCPLDASGRPDEATLEALRSCAAGGGWASPHFRFAEFACPGRSVHGFDAHVIRVDRTLLAALEQYRSIVGGPVLIAVGFQSASYRARHGGRLHGGHDEGLAADLANPVLGGHEARALGIFTSIGVRDGLAVHLGVGNVGPDSGPSYFDI